MGDSGQNGWTSDEEHGSELGEVAESYKGENESDDGFCKDNVEVDDETQESNDRIDPEESYSMSRNDNEVLREGYES